MGISVVELWLPIVLSAVAVFITAFVAWVVLPHHNADIKRLSDEDAFLADLKNRNFAPGTYMFPCYTPADLKDAEKKKKHEAGPHGILSLWPAAPNLAANLLKSMILYLLVGVFVAYLGKLALSAGADFRPVFRFTCTAAVMVYCLGLVPSAIWFGKTGRATTMDIIDGLVYGGVTGLIFAWLWPAAEVAMPAVGG